MYKIIWYKGELLPQNVIEERRISQPTYPHPPQDHYFGSCEIGAQWDTADAQVQPAVLWHG